MALCGGGGPGRRCCFGCILLSVLAATKPTICDTFCQERTEHFWAGTATQSSSRAAGPDLSTGAARDAALASHRRLPAPALLPARQVSGIYQAVPYHNFQHCVDVTHTTFMFIK